MADENDDNDVVAEARPFLPMEDFASVIQQGIEDYDDGDRHPGWFSARWNPDTQELALGYEPDDKAGAEFRGTTLVFRLAVLADAERRAKDGD